MESMKRFMRFKNGEVKTYCNGVYSAKFSDGHTYRLEKDGAWYFADGTGWRHRVEYFEMFDVVRFFPDAKLTDYHGSFPETCRIDPVGGE